MEACRNVYIGHYIQILKRIRIFTEAKYQLNRSGRCVYAMDSQTHTHLDRHHLTFIMVQIKNCKALQQLLFWNTFQLRKKANLHKSNFLCRRRTQVILQFRRGRINKKTTILQRSSAIIKQVLCTGVNPRTEPSPYGMEMEIGGAIMTAVQRDQVVLLGQVIKQAAPPSGRSADSVMSRLCAIFHVVYALQAPVGRKYWLIYVGISIWPFMSQLCYWHAVMT